MTVRQFKGAVDNLIGGQTDMNWDMEYQAFMDGGVAWLVEADWAFETLISTKEKGAIRLTSNNQPMVCDECGEGWFRKTTYNENIYSCVACNKRYLKMPEGKV